MPKTSKNPAAPLTFDLPVSLLRRIEAARKGHGADSASYIVREALAAFDFDDFVSSREEHRQISVRIDRKTRGNLKRAAKLKDVSVGELLRAAIDAFPTKPKRKAGKTKR